VGGMGGGGGSCAPYYLSILGMFSLPKFQYCETPDDKKKERREDSSEKKIFS
jgi:hypothetical protein